MDEITTVVEEKKSFKQILKEQAFTIAGTAAGIGISIWVAYDNHKRENRKEEKYVGHLEEKVELQREALGAYKDTLGSDK